MERHFGTDDRFTNRLESSFLRKVLYSFTVANAFSTRYQLDARQNSSTLTHASDVVFAQPASKLILRLQECQKARQDYLAHSQLPIYTSHVHIYIDRLHTFP